MLRHQIITFFLPLFKLHSCIISHSFQCPMGLPQMNTPNAQLTKWTKRTKSGESSEITQTHHIGILIFV